MDICNNHNDCYGCGACQAVCKHNAIIFTEDNEGFRIPAINESLCVKCGLCKAVCPANSHQVEQNELEKIFAYKLSNKEDRMKSSSGGAFISLARHVIESGGYVCGAIFDENLKVIHKLTNLPEELDLFRGSKYVQSNIEDIFIPLGNLLKQGKMILFSGTPCQCAAIKNYCIVRKIDMSNLLLCDLICHGVPSPKLWNEYCNFIKDRKNNIQKYSFRDKAQGWHGANISVTYSDGTVRKNTQKVRIFGTLYFKSLISRKSCEHCQYACFDRPSDITIGDYWGCEKHLPSFADRYGVSLIILHTDKAQIIFELCDEVCLKCEIEKNMCTQEQLVRPVDFSAHRDEFWNDYRSQGFLFVSRKYASYTVLGVIERALKNNIKKILRK